MSHPKSTSRGVLKDPTSVPKRWGEGNSGRDPSPPRTPLSFADLVPFIMAAVQLSTGGLFLALAWFTPPVEYRSWAGALILAAAVVQGKLALKALKQRRAVRGNIFRRTSFWRTAFVGVVLCYAGALVLGPNPSTPYLFVAALSVVSTLLLLPISVSPQILEDWKRISQKRIPRRTAAAMFTGVAAVVSAEVFFQGYGWVSDHGWLSFAQLQTSQSNIAPSAFVSLPGQATSPESEGQFHVAVIGDEITLGGPHNDAALAQLELTMPWIRVTNFSMPNVAPRHYAKQLAERVLQTRPNLVMAFVSVGEDVLSESSGSDLFDWRCSALARRLAPCPASLRFRSPRPKHDATIGRQRVKRLPYPHRFCHRSPLAKDAQTLGQPGSHLRTIECRSGIGRRP